MLRANVSRENFTIKVHYRNANGREQLLAFLDNFVGESGIVYTFTRKEAESLAHYLCSKQIVARAYHADVKYRKTKRIVHF